MSSTKQDPDEDWVLVQRYLDGDEGALGTLYTKYRALLLTILSNRGAKKEDAEEVDGRFWADCVANGEAHPSLLEKFGGQCPFKAWIATVATRRWYDIMRRRIRFERDLPHDPEGHEDPFDQVPSGDAPTAESTLTKLLHDCLLTAFARRDAGVLVMLHLVHRHGLSQRQVGGLWNCSEATISRHLSAAMHEIRVETLKLLQQKDPDLQLNWDDFMELCATFHFE